MNAKPSLTALLVTAVASGCTFSVKYTGASVIVFIGMLLLVRHSKCSFTLLFEFNKNDTKWQRIKTMRITKVSLKCLLFGSVAVFIL